MCSVVREYDGTCCVMVDRCSASGWIDGRTGRLPTVLVRPGTGNMAATVCYSGLVREVLQVRAAGGGWTEGGGTCGALGGGSTERERGRGPVLPLTGLLCDCSCCWCVRLSGQLVHDPRGAVAPAPRVQRGDHHQGHARAGRGGLRRHRTRQVRRRTGAQAGHGGSGIEGRSGVLQPTGWSSEGRGEQRQAYRLEGSSDARTRAAGFVCCGAGL